MEGWQRHARLLCVIIPCLEHQHGTGGRLPIDQWDPEVLRISALTGSLQLTELRDFLQVYGSSSDKVFLYGDRLRPALRQLLRDPQVGEAASRYLALLGAAAEDIRAIIENPPQPRIRALPSRWAYSVVTSLLHPTSDAEWLFLRKCAFSELSDPWAVTGAIQTLKLIASPESRAILEEMQTRVPNRKASVAQALAYIDSKPEPLVGSDLAAIAERVAQAVTIGEWKGNSPGRCDVTADKALVDFRFSAGIDEFVYTATFHRSGATWELRGVRETAQMMMISPVR
jgi:hypothetical protein